MEGEDDEAEILANFRKRNKVKEMYSHIDEEDASMKKKNENRVSISGQYFKSKIG